VKEFMLEGKKHLIGTDFMKPRKSLKTATLFIIGLGLTAVGHSVEEGFMTSEIRCKTMIDMKKRLLLIASLSLTMWASGFLCWSARGQTVILTPVDEDCLRTFDSPPFVCGWGYGSVMLQGDVEDRTIIDYNLSGIPRGIPVSNATLTFFVQTQNRSLSSTIDLFTFYGESAVQASDWNNGAFYQSFVDTFGVHELDLTSAVQSAVAAGQSFLDLRMSTTTGLCSDFIDPSWQSPGDSLTVALVPEPASLSLLAFGMFGLTLLRRRQR